MRRRPRRQPGDHRHRRRASRGRAPVRCGRRTPAGAVHLQRRQPREVDPWRLTSERGHWYLQGYDHERQARAPLPRRPDREPRRCRVVERSVLRTRSSGHRRAAEPPSRRGCSATRSRPTPRCSSTPTMWTGSPTSHGLTAGRVRADGSACVRRAGGQRPRSGRSSSVSSTTPTCSARRAYEPRSSPGSGECPD